MATYRLDPLGIVEAEPAVLDDGTALHDLLPGLGAGASRAGVSIRAEAESSGLAELGADELLIDVEDGELAGAPAVRTLVLAQLGGLATVVLEQWRLDAAGRRWTATATADLALWPRLAPGLRAVVATLEVEA